MTTYETLIEEAANKWHIDAARLQKAAAIAAGRTNIYSHNCKPGEYDVRSQGNPGGWYRVNTKAHTCTCKNSQRGHICKHRIAVWLYTETIKRNLNEARQAGRQMRPQPA
jgi:hypothetical protein